MTREAGELRAERTYKCRVLLVGTVRCAFEGPNDAASDHWLETGHARCIAIVGHETAGPIICGQFLHDEDEGRICLRCFGRLRHNLTQLPSLMVWLEAHIAASASSALDDAHVTGSHDAPMPLRLDVLDLIGPSATDAVPRELFFEQAGDPSIEDTARSWSALVAEERDRNPPANDVTSMSSYLAANLTWISEQSWVDEFANEIASLVRRAARAAPWQAEKRRVTDEACESCKTMALVTHVAEGVTVCEKRMGGCGRRREITEYAYRSRGREAS